MFQRKTTQNTNPMLETKKGTFWCVCLTKSQRLYWTFFKYNYWRSVWCKNVLTENGIVLFARVYFVLTHNAPLVFVPSYSFTHLFIFEKCFFHVFSLFCIFFLRRYTKSEDYHVLFSHSRIGLLFFFWSFTPLKCVPIEIQWNATWALCFR